MTLSRHACVTLSGIFASSSLLLAGLFAYFAWAPAGALPSNYSSEVPAAEVVAALPRIPEIGNVDDYAAIAARPLFLATRRPPETPPPVKPGSKFENPEGILLVGVVLSPSSALAVIRTPRDAAAREVSVGEKILDWQVDKILADRIVLRAGDRSVEIELLDQETIQKRYPKLKRRKVPAKPANPVRRKPASRLKSNSGR